MESLSIFIVEDKPLAAEALAFQLEKLGYQVCGLAHTGEDALEKLAIIRPDLIMLDIDLGEGMNGVAIGRELSDTGGSPYIFLTGLSDEQILEEARGTRPAAILKKPVSARSLSEAIDIAFANLGEGKPAQPRQSAPDQPTQLLPQADAIFVRTKNRYHRIPVREIDFIRADESYSIIHCRGQSHMISLKLKEVESRLNSDDLIRVHRSYIVNRNRVSGIEDHTLLVGNESVPVGKTYRDRLREYFNIL